MVENMVHVLYGQDDTYQFGRYCNSFKLEDEVKVAEKSKAYCVALGNLWFIDDSYKLRVISLATFKDSSDKWGPYIDGINDSGCIKKKFSAIAKIRLSSTSDNLWITS